MRFSFPRPFFVILCSALLFISSRSFAQIKIDFPSERSVYQRDLQGYGTISVTGSYSSDIDKIEIKAVPVYPGQGVEQDWQTLSNDLSGGTYSGAIKLFGGWYTLLLRGSKNGNEVTQATVSRTGIGEVFLIAGQSNAQGLRSYSVGPPASDDRVSYINNNENTHNSLQDPNSPTFSHLSTSTAAINPRGQGAWFYGILGDKLAARLNVPILFINTAWEGTSVENWSQSAKGEPTYNSYGGFLYPEGMPYGNLAISGRHYAHLLGVRSVIWMQGETDNHPNNMSRQRYSDALQFLINKLGQDIGKRVYWTVARTSRVSGSNSPSDSKVNQNIIDAQSDVVNTTFNPVWPGPFTDHLANPRIDGIHFATVDALHALANAWNDVFDTRFFSTVTPLTPHSAPRISIECTNNDQLTLTLPDGFSHYRWSTNSTSRSIVINSPGTYSALVKDQFGNTLHAGSLNIPSIRPVAPQLSPSTAQQICNDGEFQFNANGADHLTWYKTGSSDVLGTGNTFKAKESGNYQVTASNVYGCTSDKSAAVSLTVQPAVNTPSISKSGPFSIQSEALNTNASTKYEWYQNEQLLTGISSNLYKVDGLSNGQKANFQARAIATFTIPGTNNTITCSSELSDVFEYTRNAYEEIVVFPNPSINKVLYLESRDELNAVYLEMYDLQGKLISKEYIDILRQREKLNIPFLPRGIYLLRIKSGSFEDTKRIVIN